MINIKQLIIDNQYSFIIIDNKTNNKYYDNNIGVKPIITIINKGINLKDTYIYDKIIGKAAASLLIKYQVSYIYGYIMSEAAIKLLDKYNIKYEYTNRVSNILNKDRTDLCPLESSVINCDNIDQCIINILLKIIYLMS